MVELDDIHLTLGTKTSNVDILKGISLSLNTGKSLGIVGPSGSGKTSLLMIISGLERPTKGNVSINDVSYSNLNEQQMAHFRGKNIGIVFQSFHLIPTMTALENVAVPLELAGYNDPNDRARSTLSDVGLSHRLEHKPAQLSGGEQQRVALSRAMVTGAKLLLADEPTGNLDLKTGNMIADLLFEMQDKLNTSLILVSHDLELVKRCDQILTMKDGLIEQTQ